MRLSCLTLPLMRTVPCFPDLYNSETLVCSSEERILTALASRLRFKSSPEGNTLLKAMLRIMATGCCCWA